MKNRLLVAVALVLLSCPGFAQIKKAEIKDLAFMAGTWVQKSSWGDLEEFWSQPNGESLMGAFRCIQDGKAVFYEFMAIELDQNLPVLKLRHYNPGSIGWEEKDKPLLFPLTTLEPNLAVFQMADGSVKLTYQLVAKTKLNVILEEKEAGGKIKKDSFNFTLKP
jgi:hypothetical protein